MRNAALITLACDSHLELLEYTGPIFAQYSEKWKLDYCPITEKLDNNRPAAWSKLLAIRNAFDKYDYVVYIDVDAIILRGEQYILDVPPPQFELAWAKSEVNNVLVPNAGVMLFRNTNSTQELLDLAYRQEDLIYDGWWEQAALLRVLGHHDPRGHSEASKSRRRLIEINEYILPDSWNLTSHSQDFKSPFIRHLAGDPLIIKKVLLLELLFRTFTLNNLSEMGFDVDWLKYEHRNLLLNWEKRKDVSISQFALSSSRILNRIIGRSPKYK